MGQRPADLLDLPGDLLMPGRSEAEVLSHLGHQLTSDGDHSAKQGQEIVTGSGRVLQALSNPAPGGGWISTFTDITRMREAESALRTAKERAEAANQAKSRFLATMSHELLTPLNAIIGFSEALARDGGDVPANLVSDYSGQINTAGKQLLSLINIVLDVARIESGRFEPDAEIVDIGKAMRTAQRQVDGAARAGDVSVELRIPDELPWLRGDERRITQVLSQVLSNAVKFTQSGGSVLVEAGLTEAEDVFVSVTDTGIGIPEDELERVFQPFSQIDGSLSRRYQGAGLGLFTARAVVTAHGGTLLLTSQRGAGTTARIVLPRTRLIERADR